MIGVLIYKQQVLVVQNPMETILFRTGTRIMCTEKRFRLLGASVPKKSNGDNTYSVHVQVGFWSGARRELSLQAAKNLVVTSPAVRRLKSRSLITCSSVCSRSPRARARTASHNLYGKAEMDLSERVELEDSQEGVNCSRRVMFSGCSDVLFESEGQIFELWQTQTKV